MRDSNEHIRGIAPFLHPKVRRRYVSLCDRSLERAMQAVWKDHFFPVDEKAVCRINVETRPLAEQLKSFGAPDECWFVREFGKPGAGFNKLTEITQMIEGSLHHAVISCIPGELIYFEGEMSTESLILTIKH